MTKRINQFITGSFLVAMLGLLLALSPSARAQNQAPVQKQPQKSQLKQIQQSAKSGQLARTAQHLTTMAGKVQAEQAKAKNSLNPKQRAQLQHEAKRAKSTINHLKHNKKISG